MSELIMYLLKANIALTLFYLGYYFWLRDLTFYRLNRYYLLFALIFSAMYPLVNIKALTNSGLNIPAEAISILPNLNDLQFTQQGIDFNRAIEYMFWLGFALAFFNLLIKLWGILRIHLSSVREYWNFYSYRKSSEDIAPFSFWKSIYLNPDKHNEVEFEQILKHEFVHVRQLHSLDTLVAEVIFIFFWYNPISWFLRKVVHENLEFITDRKVLSGGINKQSYQYSLLNISTLPTMPVLGNHFNIKSLKKRIWMMNRKKTSNLHLSKYILILPLIIVGSLIFSFSNAKETILHSSIKDNSIKQVNENSEQVSVKVNDKPLSDGISENVVILLDGVRLTKEDLNKIDVNKIESMNVYKDETAIAKFGKDAEGGVIEITLKSK